MGRRMSTVGMTGATSPVWGRSAARARVVNFPRPSLLFSVFRDLYDENRGSDANDFGGQCTAWQASIARVVIAALMYVSPPFLLDPSSFSTPPPPSQPLTLTHSYPE
jgi:hypothetical protein